MNGQYLDRVADLQNNMNERNRRMMQFSQYLSDETVRQHQNPKPDLYYKHLSTHVQQSEQENQT